MEEAKVLALLEEKGAILEGHFELSSGRHSGVYVEKFRVLEDPESAMALGEALAGRWEGRGVEVVLSPAVGAVVLGFATAAALGARFVFAERVAGAMVMRRGFEIHPAERVAVVEDVVTTGGSLLEVVALAPPGELAAVGCLLDRSGGTLKLPAAMDALARLDAPSWDPDSCPLCAGGGVPARRGSRRLG